MQFEAVPVLQWVKQGGILSDTQVAAMYLTFLHIDLLNFHKNHVRQGN